MKPKKPLTWLFPDAVAREYEADLRQFARAITQAVADALRLHQDDWRSDLLKILMDLPQQLEQQTEQAVLSATLHAQAVNRFNDTQFHRVVSSAYGQDFYKPEPFLADALTTWTMENARLIQSIPEQYIGQVRQMVSDAAVNGWDEATLKAKIAESFRLPEARATLIANDQIGKLNGQLTRLRQQNIGIKQYRWRGKLDSRERDSHLKREGKIFDWDNPPSGGHPGSEINCRCHAQMIMPEMAEIDALFFGDGGNRHYNAEMARRGLTPEAGGAAVYANPFAQYGYLPRGGAMPARSSGSLQQVLETAAKEAVRGMAHAASTKTMQQTSAQSTVLIDTAILGVWQNISELRQKAKEYAKTHLSGQKVQNIETGHEIIIGMGGIKHTLTGAQDALLLTIPLIDKIIQAAHLTETVADKHADPNIVSIERYRVWIDLNGEQREVVITVKHHLDGRRYYDHGFVKK